MSVDRPRPLVAGNWKMNGRKAALEVLGEIAAGYGDDLREKVDLAVFPPATLLASFAEQAIGHRHHGRRAGLPRQGIGRLHRRPLGRDAQRMPAPSG